MSKKSTKYQLLKDDFDHACRELKLRNKLIQELREENASLERQLAEWKRISAQRESQFLINKDQLEESEQKIKRLEERLVNAVAYYNSRI